MSKKLWQAIGKETQPQTQHLIRSLNNNPPPKLVPSSRSRPVIQQSQEKAREEVEGEMSIEIQSCQSEQLQSQPSNPRLPHKPSYFLIEKVMKNRVRTLQEQTNFLRNQLLTFKRYTADQLHAFSSQFSSAAHKFYNQFSKQTSQKIMQPCQKCENSKNIIDSLTRQCWELQDKLKQKTDSHPKAHQPLPEHPMRKIEASLLQERAQTIKHLKSQIEQAQNEVQLLRSENEALFQELQGKEDQVKELQAQYRNCLISFKSEIQVINETCCSKIQRTLQEKTSIESEYRLLQQKYYSLQEALEKEQLKRNNKRFFTQMHPQPNITYSSTALQLDMPPSQPYIPSTVTPRHDTASLINIQLPRTTNHRQTTYKSFFQQTPTRHPPSQPFFPKNRQADTMLKSKQWAQTTAQSRNSNKSSISSMSSALEKLSELQKDVRKEINRSKNSYK